MPCGALPLDRRSWTGWSRRKEPPQQQRPPRRGAARVAGGMAMAGKTRLPRDLAVYTCPLLSLARALSPTLLSLLALSPLSLSSWSLPNFFSPFSLNNLPPLAPTLCLCRTPCGSLPLALPAQREAAAFRTRSPQPSRLPHLIPHAKRRWCPRTRNEFGINGARDTKVVFIHPDTGNLSESSEMPPRPTQPFVDTADPSPSTLPILSPRLSTPLYTRWLQ